MDWINKYNMILEKIKNQLHAKGVDSLDKIFICISQMDPENNNFLDITQFEKFLSLMGIFLKTQVINFFKK
jgi:hypothetical protein